MHSFLDAGSNADSAFIFYSSTLVHHESGAREWCTRVREWCKRLVHEITWVVHESAAREYMSGAWEKLYSTGNGSSRTNFSRLGMGSPGEATSDTDTRQHREQKNSSSSSAKSGPGQQQAVVKWRLERWSCSRSGSRGHNKSSGWSWLAYILWCRLSVAQIHKKLQAMKIDEN